MASKDLTFNLYGVDRSASSAINGVGSNAQRMGQSFAKAGAAVAAGLAVAGAAAVAFGIDSVKAFAESETQQNKLLFAYEKFPALADASLASLKKLNSELAKTTKYDDDATAAAQAVLAQFKLTGKQLTVLTPLLQDYASATGKDLTTAAEDLGKALLGQGRALKSVGIDFQDTGTLAGNFDQLMGQLSSSVGGFAANEGQTAAGQLAILQNRFGEFQETIGAALLPSLTQLMDTFELEVMPGLEKFANWLADEGIPGLTGFIDWWNKYSNVAGPAAVLALAAVTAGVIALNVAMLANPIGIVIAGLIAGIAWWTSFGIAVNSIISLMNTNWGWFQAAGVNALNAVFQAANFLLGPLQGVLNLINAITGARLNVQLPSVSATYQPPRARGMAEGGIVPAQPGGIFANIGEGKHDEIVLPLTDRNLQAIGGGGRGGGDVYNMTINGFIGGDNQAAQKIAQMVRNAKKSGAIPANALGPN